jgi:hypothetical protein
VDYCRFWGSRHWGRASAFRRKLSPVAYGRSLHDGQRTLANVHQRRLAGDGELQQLFAGTPVTIEDHSAVGRKLLCRTGGRGAISNGPALLVSMPPSDSSENRSGSVLPKIASADLAGMRDWLASEPAFQASIRYSGLSLRRALEGVADYAVLQGIESHYKGGVVQFLNDRQRS